ncbi:penicillin-binding protein [Sediminibacillus halophilus]|uniref:serine-type D-Ala-D-Ala carboxypeptidase n=1 Tax=Sediminibacillus halophilus TaxID=482461 RepID=A0A1G9MRS3_9BACI|nr:penicillin-binding protein [Sediminibacillus halophilus]SDL77006.1 penicillin-binding protein 2B [Sediminibacillus halophilus]
MRKNKTTHVMSSVFMLLFIVLFLVLSGRFLYIQGTGEVDGVSLQEWADKKRTNSYVIEAERGQILDRNGMPLAYDRAVYQISAIVDESYSEGLEEPKHVDNIDKAADQLAPLLNMDAAKIAEIMKKGQEEGRFQVEFGVHGKNITQETKEKIEDLDIPGINFEKDSIRYYPNGTFASQVIGIAQQQEDKLIGRNGIEAEMDDVLSGKNGSISYKRDNFNTKLLDPDEVIKQADDGEDVYLTIDQKIQTLLEDAMSQVEKDYKPERMTAVVMNPKTGEVVAMSNRPSYNPNELGEVSNWYNDVVSNPFEPGSTMKIFTLAAAIEEGVFNPDEYYESGSYQNDKMNTPIHDWRGNWGTITYKEGIQRSSNVAAAKLVWEKLGPDKFLDYLKAFHFDQKTGIDLPNEQPGHILYDWPIEKVTTSYGQGTTVTPIQLMMAASAIANDGKMMKPYVISKIVNSETGQVMKENEPKQSGQPVSGQTAEEVKDILETVITSEHGTGHNIYNLNDYSVAGKTGTAQIPDSETGRYMTGEENYLFSFLGMAPKEDPELMMYVSVKQPDLEENESGSAPVSYIFKNVMENSLHYLNIEPDQKNEQKVKTVSMPDIDGLSINKAKEKLESKGLKPVIIGSGKKVEAFSSRSGEQLLANEKVFILTEKPEMPDVNGWSMRDVLKFGDLTGIEIETMGNGFAVKQSIKKGTALKKDDYLVVEFSPPNHDEDSKVKEEENPEASDEGSGEQ